MYHTHVYVYIRFPFVTPDSISLANYDFVAKTKTQTIRVLKLRNSIQVTFLLNNCCILE